MKEIFIWVTKVKRIRVRESNIKKSSTLLKKNEKSKNKQKRHHLLYQHSNAAVVKEENGLLQQPFLFLIVTIKRFSIENFLLNTINFCFNPQRYNHLGVRMTEIQIGHYGKFSHPEFSGDDFDYGFI